VDAAEVLAGVEVTGLGNGLLDQVMDGADALVVVEEVAEDRVDAAQGTVADQDQGEGELLQPGAGDGQAEEDLPLGRQRRGKGAVEGLAGPGALRADELAADVVLACALGEGLSGKGIEGHALALLGAELLGRAGRRGMGLGGGRSRGQQKR
jgi:hypothetical protein